MVSRDLHRGQDFIRAVEQLRQLASLIAPYPDSLEAQILGGATYADGATVSD
jgi:hypothetical protein